MTRKANMIAVLGSAKRHQAISKDLLQTAKENHEFAIKFGSRQEIYDCNNYYQAMLIQFEKANELVEIKQKEFEELCE